MDSHAHPTDADAAAPGRPAPPDPAALDSALAWLRANEAQRSPWPRSWLLGGLTALVLIPSVLCWLGMTHAVSVWLVLALLSPLLWAGTLVGLMARANVGDSVGQTGAGALLRALASETVSTLQVMALEMALRWRQCPNIIGAKYRGQTGVILVHGYQCHRSAWNAWLRRWASVNRPCVAVNLGATEGLIMDHAPVVAQAIHAMRTITGRDPVVVGHSLGGLALRAWWQAHGAQDAGVARFITLGTPHQGTRLARLARSVAALDMRPDSDFLQRTRQHIDRHGLPPALAWLTPTDPLVTPASAAALAAPAVGPAPENRITTPCGHNALLLRPDLMDEVLALTQALDAPAAAPAFEPAP
ncbi:esterase/lipase family protein [Amphibiibacter pelophylacis]|uniref:Alpha/beta fold hydrolase n=1 Tax=Amphibiibacter pelophylacis TaxID=1799477 RepID=A0ACC6P273_9BURK